MIAERSFYIINFLLIFSSSPKIMSYFPVYTFSFLRIELPVFLQTQVVFFFFVFCLFVVGFFFKCGTDLGHKTFL